MTKAIDISNFWVPAPVTDAEALTMMRSARKAGVRRVIAGTQVPSVCNQQLVAADLAGMTTEAYLQIRWDKPMGPQLDEALYAIGGEPIRRLWLAVEPNGGQPALAPLLDLVRQARVVLPKKLGIYTNLNSWGQIMGNPLVLEDLPLWWAYYDELAYITAPAWRAFGFGPWFKPAMKQYSANVTLAGMNCDLNVY